MTQPKYLYKPHGMPLRQGDIKAVRHPAVYALDHTVEIPGLGRSQVMKSTGRVDRGKFQISIGGMSLTVTAERAEIKKRVRLLREREAGLLDEIDTQLAALRARRAEILAEAWARGNVVTVTELEGLTP